MPKLYTVDCRFKWGSKSFKFRFKLEAEKFVEIILLEEDNISAQLVTP
jgi:hypothetical protein